MATTVAAGMRRKTRKSRRMLSVTFAAQRDTVRRLDELARERDQSRGNVIRDLLSAGLSGTDSAGASAE